MKSQLQLLAAPKAEAGDVRKSELSLEGLSCLANSLTPVVNHLTLGQQPQGPDAKAQRIFPQQQLS